MEQPNTLICETIDNRWPANDCRLRKLELMCASNANLGMSVDALHFNEHGACLLAGFDSNHYARLCW